MKLVLYFNTFVKYDRNCSLIQMKPGTFASTAACLITEFVIMNYNFNNFSHISFYSLYDLVTF